ncbi:MAG: S41 family peptidase [Candidatus Pacebacteria bacterium]|nr:S41 family peptidase [Candidatus Paceibacterota bacterium]
MKMLAVIKNFTVKNKSLLTGILTVAVLLSAIGMSYYAGYRLGVTNPQTIIVKGVDNKDIEAEQVKNADFGVFWQVWQKLKDEHIKGAEAKDKDLVYGAIKGLVDSLGDPNTNFLPPSDAKKFEQDVTGSFGGVGAELGMKDGLVVVIAPLAESPAEKAGILAGDKIIEVDHKNIEGLDVNEAVKKIRGEIGTQVTLTVLHNGNEKPVDITITRARIEVPTLKMEMKENNIAHIQLYQFNDNASFLFYKSAISVLFGQSKGIILDLRNNPGGYLEVAVNLAGWFVDRGNVVVTEKFRSGKEAPFNSNGNAALKDIPMVVLMNKGSASASEILAGALRHYVKAKLIGENSFGKGTVQELQTLKDGSEIKITIAQWLLPDGKVLDEAGLKPDIEVKMTEQDIKDKKDPQLDRAIQELNKMISAKQQ